MGYYFSKYTGAGAAGLSPSAVLIIDAVLVAVLIICAYTDGTQGKIYNKITFPAMLAGLALNTVFGGTTGFVWALIGWAVGMGIQWVPFMVGVAKAGDVKLLASVGALKGWAFCLFGFLYGSIAFGVLILPWLARRGQLGEVGQNLKNYFAIAAVTQQAPDAPAPVVTKRFVPWGVGLVIGFFVALVLERIFNKPLWF